MQPHAVFIIQLFPGFHRQPFSPCPADRYLIRQLQPAQIDHGLLQLEIAILQRDLRPAAIIMTAQSALPAFFVYTQQFSQQFIGCFLPISSCWEKVFIVNTFSQFCRLGIKQRDPQILEVFSFPLMAIVFGLGQHL